MNGVFRVLDHTADGAFVIDENQRIIYWNHTAQQMLGYTAEEVLNRACNEIMLGEDDRGWAICRYHCPVATAALGGKTVRNYDALVRTKDGEPVWVNMSILSVPAEVEDEITLIVHLFRDASQQKRNEQLACGVLDIVKRLQRDETAGAGVANPTDVLTKELTRREHEVLTLLSRGLGTDDIAQSLSISPATTRNHIQSIFNKLQVHSRVEAVARALELSLINRH